MSTTPPIQIQLQEPYKSLREYPLLDHGWNNNSKQLADLVATHFPGADDLVIVEIGSWLGCSIRDWEKLAGERGRVYAVDHWEGSVEHQVGGFAHHDALPRLYPQFLSNMIHWGIAHRVTPVRLSSLHAAAALNIACDIAYIDGSHAYVDVLADMQAWWPKLSSRGKLCGDDWLWHFEAMGIQRAVNEFVNEHDLELMVEGNFWAVHRKK